MTVALLLCLALVMLFLGRIRRRRVQDEAEAEGREAVTFGGDSLKEGWAWLKDTARLFRRYGFSRHLLAAISVENMYANVCRLARQQGFPRPPAQPPDDYLPTLQQVFSQQEAPLAPPHHQLHARPLRRPRSLPEGSWSRPAMITIRFVGRSGRKGRDTPE